MSNLAIFLSGMAGGVALLIVLFAVAGVVAEYYDDDPDWRL